MGSSRPGVEDLQRLVDLDTDHLYRHLTEVGMGGDSFNMTLMFPFLTSNSSRSPYH